MPFRVPPSRIAQALEYLQGLKSGVGEFVGGVGSNLADRARAAGGLAYEALTTDPNIGRMTTAEFSQAAADRAPTPRLDQAARDIGTIGRAIVTQPVETGKAIVGGEIDRFKGAFASPQAAGEYAGSLIDPTRLAAALRHRIPISELDVYHGTPHKYAPTEANPLGEFDASKIGTGEGAQAYGHGIYLAESPGVAKSYLPKQRYDVDADGSVSYMMTPPGTYNPTVEARDALDQAVNAREALLASRDAPDFEQRWQQATESINAAERAYDEASKQHWGSLYKADLPDEMIDRMLDYDKPLTQQPKNVQAALAKLGNPQEKLDAYDDALLKALFEDAADPGSVPRNPSGADILKKLENQYGRKGASDYLRGLGIPGIRYLDAGSRGQGGSGTRNFVVFPGEEKKVRILERK